MNPALVPEFAVTNWQASKKFYCDVLGFECVYDRVEEGFSYLKLGEAALMIDQISLGRSFDQGHLPKTYPFGKGLNVEIRVASVAPMVAALAEHEHELFLPVEEKWYRIDDRKSLNRETGNRQFIVADPDGYLLRFYEDLGFRLTSPHPVQKAAF